jgi:hypothetical protein
MTSTQSMGIKLLVLGLGFAFAAGTLAQAPSSPVKVVVKDGKVVTEEAMVPVDPTPRITIGHSPGMFNFGLSVDGNRICCSPQGSIWLQARVDGQQLYIGQGDGKAGFGGTAGAGPQPLPPSRGGKKRLGNMWSWTHGDLQFTQIVEVVPSKPAVGKLQPGQKRRLDTCRITQIVENKGNQPHKVELRQCVDMLIVNNDGALYASPTTHAGRVLNGIELKGKDLPTFVQCLERPNIENPGFVAVITLNMGKKVKSPDRILLTNLGTVSNFDAPAQAAGDSACAMCWDPIEIKAKSKQTFAWGYGGNFATDPDNDGLVSLALGGSFEPGKVFTITAYVDDPMTNQTLALELPPGMERVEGKEVQPVALPNEDSATGIVMWKARVFRTGDYTLKVKSSTGVTQSKSISIQPADSAPTSGAAVSPEPQIRNPNLEIRNKSEIRNQK